jgi:hypothetical protein
MRMSGAKTGQTARAGGREKEAPRALFHAQPAAKVGLLGKSEKKQNFF